MNLVIHVYGNSSDPALKDRLDRIPTKVRGFDHVRILWTDSNPDTPSDAPCEFQGAVLRIPGSPATGLRSAMEAGLEIRADVLVDLGEGNPVTVETIEALTSPVLSGDLQIVAGVSSSALRSRNWLDRLCARVTGVSATTCGNRVRAYSREAMLALRLTGAPGGEAEVLFRVAQEGLRYGEVKLGGSIDSTPRARQGHLCATVFRETLALHALVWILTTTSVPVAMLVFWRPLPVLASTLLAGIAVTVGTLAAGAQFWVNYRLEQRDSALFERPPLLPRSQPTPR